MVRAAVFIFVPTFPGGACGSGGSNIIGATDPQMTGYVQPQQTLHLTARPRCLRAEPEHHPVAAEVTTLLLAFGLAVLATRVRPNPSRANRRLR